MEHRVIRMDTIGHGPSDAPNGNYALTSLTDDALGLIRHRGLNDVTVMGVSLGGMMVQDMAARALDMAQRVGTPQTLAERIGAVRTGGCRWHRLRDPLTMVRARISGR